MRHGLALAIRAVALSPMLWLVGTAGASTLPQVGPGESAVNVARYDTAEVVYRTVNSEGYVSYRGNLYSVPWQCLGEFLPVRITETELIVYGTDIEEIARHELFARTGERQKRTNEKHILGSDHRNKCEILRQRFEQLGPEAVSFFDELVRVKRCGKEEAR